MRWRRTGQRIVRRGCATQRSSVPPFPRGRRPAPWSNRNRSGSRTMSPRTTWRRSWPTAGTYPARRTTYQAHTSRPKTPRTRAVGRPSSTEPAVAARWWSVQVAWSSFSASWCSGRERPSVPRSTPTSRPRSRSGPPEPQRRRARPTAVRRCRERSRSACDC